MCTCTCTYTCISIYTCTCTCTCMYLKDCHEFIYIKGQEIQHCCHCWCFCWLCLGSLHSCCTPPLSLRAASDFGFLLSHTCQAVNHPRQEVVELLQPDSCFSPVFPVMLHTGHSAIKHPLSTAMDRLVYRTICWAIVICRTVNTLRQWRTVPWDSEPSGKFLVNYTHKTHDAKLTTTV